MKGLLKGPLDEKLQGYRLSLSNALSYPALRKPLTTFSYDHAKLLKGQALLEKVLEMQSSKDNTYGAQKDATDAIARHGPPSGSGSPSTVNWPGWPSKRSAASSPNSN